MKPENKHSQKADGGDGDNPELDNGIQSGDRNGEEDSGGNKETQFLR